MPKISFRLHHFPICRCVWVIMLYVYLLWRWRCYSLLSLFLSLISSLFLIFFTDHNLAAKFFDMQTISRRSLYISITIQVYAFIWIVMAGESQTHWAILSINLSSMSVRPFIPASYHINQRIHTKGYEQIIITYNNLYRDAFCLRKWIECSFCIRLYISLNACMCAQRTRTNTHTTVHLSIHPSISLVFSYNFAVANWFFLISGFSISTKWIRWTKLNHKSVCLCLCVWVERKMRIIEGEKNREMKAKTEKQIIMTMKVSEWSVHTMGRSH